MNAATASPSTQKPAAPPPGFLATKPDPAACASRLQVEGTLPAGEWKAVLEFVANAVCDHNVLDEKRRGAAKTRRLAAIAVLAAVAGGLAIAGVVKIGAGMIFVALVTFFFGLFVVFKSFKVPGRDHVGEERVKFLSSLLGELARIAPDARVSLAAQIDSRRAFDMRPFENFAAASSTRDCEDAWLRGQLAGLPGLYLGWSVTEWNAVTVVRKRNPRGKIKIKGKLSVARRFSVRVDADGALFSATPAAPAKAGPDTVIEVRAQPRGYSVRARHDFKGTAALPDPGQIGESLVQIRENAARHGQDRADLFGEFASTLVHLMKQCEQRLAPRATRKEAA